MSDSIDSDDSTSEESEEDEVSVPWTIQNTSDFVDMSFHPRLSESLATCDMNGYFRMFSCKPGEDCLETAKVRLSRKPTRCLAFSSDGEDVLVMTKDHTLHIICSSTGSTKRVINPVHSSSPYCISVINKNLVATGDEDGILKLWDLRRGDTPVMKEHKFNDYISEIVVDDNQRLIFAVSGDGTMTSYNARQRKFIIQSQNEECDLLCAKPVRFNKKLAVGTSKGPILLYNWDEFAASSDSFHGHPGPVDSMAKISENVLCTASSDGVVRAVNILPNRFLGVVGGHIGLPVDKVRSTHDGDLLASISHDSTVRFWDVAYLKNIEVDGTAKARKVNKYKRLGQTKRQAFLCDIDKELEVPECDFDSDDVASDDSGNNENPE